MVWLSLEPREAEVYPFFTVWGSASVPFPRSCRGLLDCDTTSSPGDSHHGTDESQGRAGVPHRAGAAPRGGPRARALRQGQPPPLLQGPLLSPGPATSLHVSSAGNDALAGFFQGVIAHSHLQVMAGV